MNMLRPRLSLYLFVTALALTLPAITGCLGTEQETVVTPAPAPASTPDGAAAPEGIAGPGDIDPSQK